MKVIYEDFINGLYVNTLASQEYQAKGYILFVHGGPGSHSGYFQKMISTIDAYNSSKWGWICYDQRGCGKSKGALLPCHEDNVKDLYDLYMSLKEKSSEPIRAVFGHSYGARVAFDTFRLHQDLPIKLIVAGRALYRNDPMNLSLLMDMYILRKISPNKYKKGYKFLKNFEGEPIEKATLIRKLFNDGNLKERMQYYWGNLEVMEKYVEVKRKVDLKDNDAVMGSVLKSIIGSKWDHHTFDSTDIKQDSLIINGFWDFMMAGSTTAAAKNATTFMGSGHYPHFEEPERFMEELDNLLR